MTKLKIASPEEEALGFRYYLNLGSNLGNPEMNIAEALNLLKERFGELTVSEMVESKPWGFDSANLFINIGVAFNSEMEPLQMLDTLQEMERRLSPVKHRNGDGSYKDREIDIDIMSASRRFRDRFEEVRVDTPRLTLPHRHLQDRDFFYIPLRQLYAATFPASHSDTCP